MGHGGRFVAIFTFILVISVSGELYWHLLSGALKESVHGPERNRHPSY